MRNTLILACLLPTLGLAQGPLRVTTDNGAYCDEMLRRLAAEPAAAHGLPARLAGEGRALCLAGNPRSGVARLRRALRMASTRQG